MKDENFKRIEGIQEHIEASNYAMYEASQTLIYNEMCDLVAWKSFVGKMWAEYRRELNSTKVKAYNNLVFSQRSINYDLSPSLTKDYIAAKCGDLQHAVDFTDRVNANLSYSIEVLRSILSSLKEEMKNLNYGSSNQ